MRGIRNPNDGLWDIPLPTRKFSPTPNTHHTSLPNKKYHAIHMVALHPSLLVIIRKDTTKVDLAQYLHAACFSLVISTGKSHHQQPFFHLARLDITTYLETPTHQSDYGTKSP